MQAVEEITPPAFGRCGLLVLLVLLEELLLLIRIGLEEGAADLMKGTTQALEEFAPAAFGEPSTEGLLDPGARLSRGLEVARGDLAFEVVELRRLESEPGSPWYSRVRSVSSPPRW